MRKNKVCGIYKITNPENKIYIGQSLDIRGRVGCYKHLSCKNQRKLYESLLTHGWENHFFEVIHYCLPSELEEQEIKFISMFDSTNQDKGLNLSKGGGILSEESRKRISESKKGIKHPFFGKKQSPEMIKKRAASMMGRPCPLETRRKISLAHIGIKLSDSHILALSNSKKGLVGRLHNRSKPVIQCNLRGEAVQEWESIRQAAIKGGFSDSCIVKTCKGKSKQHCGFTWRYKA